MLQQIFHMHFVPWLSLFHFLAISLIPSLSSPPMPAGRGVVTTFVSSPNSLITLCSSASSFTCSSTKAQVGSKLATQKGQGSQPHAAFLWASHPNLFYRAKFRPLEFSSSKLFSSVFFHMMIWSGVWPEAMVWLTSVPAIRSCRTFWVIFSHKHRAEVFVIYCSVGWWSLTDPSHPRRSRRKVQCVLLCPTQLSWKTALRSVILAESGSRGRFLRFCTAQHSWGSCSISVRREVKPSWRLERQQAEEPWRNFCLGRTVESPWPQHYHWSCWSRPPWCWSPWSCTELPCQLPSQTS